MSFGYLVYSKSVTFLLMITLPDRLYRENFVEPFYRSASVVMLRKQISRTLPERTSYVARHVITMITAGEQRIRAYDGETMTLRAGEMGAVRRGLYTVTDLVSDVSGFAAYLLFFDDNRLKQAFPASTSATSASPPFYSFQVPAYLPSFWRSVEAMHAALPDRPPLMNLKVDEFFAVLKASEAGSTLGERLASWTTPTPRSLRRFMEENYDKALTIEDYAYLTGRSESSFRRDFKARFGTTPRRWIIRQRLEKAERLLGDTDWNVARVAEAVGYDNVSHFISAFKKQYQRTPGQKPVLAKSLDRKTAF